MSFSNNSPNAPYIHQTMPVRPRGVRRSLMEQFNNAATPNCPDTPFVKRVKTAWNEDAAQVSINLDQRFDQASSHGRTLSNS